jgi:hypothetical protein
MTNSYKNYLTNLEKRAIKTRHEERRQFQELKDRLERRYLATRIIREWLREKEYEDGDTRYTL